MVDSVSANVSTNVATITGDTGSHDASTSTGKAANAGETVGEALNGGTKDVNTTHDISYSSSTDDGGVDVDAGLDYANEVVDSVDENNDGGITLGSEEQEKAEEGLGIEDISVADTNADNIVDRAEYLSLTIVQDCTGDEGSDGVLDGIASAEEAKALNSMIKDDAEDTKAQIKIVHDGYVAEKAAGFTPALTKAEKALQIAEENEAKINDVEEKAEVAKATADDAQDTADEANETAVAASAAAASAGGAAAKANEKADQNAEDIADMKELLAVFTLSQQLGIPFELLCSMLGLDPSGLLGENPMFGSLTTSQSPLLQTNSQSPLSQSSQNVYGNLTSLFFQDSDPTNDLLNPFTAVAYMF